MTVERRACSQCKKNRALKFFSGPKARVCRPCQTASARRRNRDRRLRETYGISADEYDALLKAQGGVCGICGGERKGSLDVDHDHKLANALASEGYPAAEAVRRSVRGLLCRQDNRRVLAAARDNPERLRRAADYLEHPPARELLSA